MDIQIYMWFDSDNEKELNKDNGYKIIMPISIKETLDETLDSGHFQMITTDSEQIKPFTKSKLVINGKESYWFANSTATVFNSKKGTYKHDVYLIEPTKILERHILGARAFSSGSSFFTTNEELIKLIIETCYPDNPNPLSNLVLDTKDRKEFNENSREYFFPEQTTLFEALEAIGKSINAFPRLKDFNTLVYDFFDNEKQYELGEKNVFYEQISYDINQYANSIESYVNNVVDEDNPIYALDDKNGISIRSETIRITEDTGQIILDKPIYKVLSVKVAPTEKASANFQIDFGTKDFVPIIPIDISNYIYDKKEWDLLDPEPVGGTIQDHLIIHDDKQLCTLYYTSGQKTIENMFSYKKHWSIVFGGQISVIKQILNNKFFNASLFEKREHFGEEVSSVFNGFINDDLTDLEYIVEYIPLDTIKAKIYKNRYELNKAENNTLIYNQNANIIDMSYYGKNLQATIQKLGNESYSIAFKDKLNIIPKAGEKIGDYYISVVDVEYYNNYNKIKVELVKYYNKIAANVGIDSQLRLYNIPNDNYVTERIIHLDRFCFLDTKKSAEESSDFPLYGEQIFKRILLQTITPGVFDTFHEEYKGSPLASLFINHYDKMFIKPTSSFEIGNSFLISFGFDDNSLAGYQKNGDKSKSVLYVDEKGEVETLRFEINKHKSYAENTQQSVANMLPKNIMGGDPDNILLPMIHSPVLSIKKDSREVLKFNYQMHFLSDNPNIIIGDVFSKSSLFSYQGARGGRNWMYVQRNIYLFEEKLNHNTKKRLKGTGYIPSEEEMKLTIIDDEYVNVFINETLKTNYKSFVITNFKDEVILICNDINVEKIYFNFSNSYN